MENVSETFRRGLRPLSPRGSAKRFGNCLSTIYLIIGSTSFLPVNNYTPIVWRTRHRMCSPSIGKYFSLFIVHMIITI